MIYFLHTYKGHVDTFQKITDGVGAPSTHLVNTEILPAITKNKENGLRVLDDYLDSIDWKDCDLLICTCSTLGVVIEERSAKYGFPMIRLDRPMYELAEKQYDQVILLYTAPSTIKPIKDLVDQIFGQNRVEYLCCVGAWEYFIEGNLGRYYEIIDRYLDAIKDCEAVLLAQASMSYVKELNDYMVPVLDPVDQFETWLAFQLDEA